MANQIDIGKLSEREAKDLLGRLSQYLCITEVGEVLNEYLTSHSRKELLNIVHDDPTDGEREEID